jgi:hypothetical protein
MALRFAACAALFAMLGGCVLFDPFYRTDTWVTRLGPDLYDVRAHVSTSETYTKDAAEKACKSPVAKETAPVATAKRRHRENDDDYYSVAWRCVRTG